MEKRIKQLNLEEGNSHIAYNTRSNSISARNSNNDGQKKSFINYPVEVLEKMSKNN